MRLSLDWSSCLVATGAIALCVALGISAGFVDLVALALVTVALALSIVASLPLVRAPAPRPGAGVAVVLGAGLAYSLLHHLALPARIAVRAARTDEYRFTMFACAAVVATFAWTGAPRSVRLARFALLTVLVGVLGVLVIRSVPAPRIDVWHLQQLGALQLAEGRNPYATAYPNIYGPRTPFIDPSLLSPDGLSITAFPYTPLTLLLDVPAALGGDVRWALLIASLASAWLIRALGRGTSVAELAGALLLLQPQGLWVLERSWTEPFALVTILAAAWTVSRVPGWIGPGVALGVAASSKQYAPLMAAPLWLAMRPPLRGRALAAAVATAAALALPFIAWDAPALVRGVLEFQLRQPFRPDALSWPAGVLKLGGPLLPTWPAFILAAAALVSIGPRPSVKLALVGGASAWIAFVLFNKQAFCNYYWLAVGLLCAAAAMVRPLDAQDAPAHV